MTKKYFGYKSHMSLKKRQFNCLKNVLYCTLIKHDNNLTIFINTNNTILVFKLP